MINAIRFILIDIYDMILSAAEADFLGMLQRFLHIPDEEMPKKLDATDALAIAYCHYLQLGMPVSEGGAKDWTTYAKRKGLTDKDLTGPNAKLMAALASVNKKK